MPWNGTTRRLIVSTARRFFDYLECQNGGELPQTEYGWITLHRRFDIHAGPFVICPDGYDARLWYDADLHKWFVAYNPAASETNKCLYLAHEAGEWLAVNDHPSLFDGLPGLTPGDGLVERVYHYDGGPDPQDIRHLIARRIERLYCRRTGQRRTTE